MLKTLGAALLLLFVGCSTNIARSPFREVLLADYTLDEVRETTVGQPIFQLERTAIRDAYEVRFDYEAPETGLPGHLERELQKGDRYTVAGQDPADSNSLFLRAEGSDEEGFLSIHADGTVNRGWVHSTGVVPVQGDWTSSPLFEKSEQPSYAGESLYIQLLYSGVEGDTVRATYREFSNDPQSPQFSQELAYDLSISRVIAYRSIQIEILDATNSVLRYRVISEGDLGWVPQ